ncbi:hypothetical protein CLAVI_000994 [Candidatus Clavichlamydia salmonicola]|uniref:hypothetical protein n=1 Tax=Candidatus Clavichlamydia salmonicola TaxID=469812 RepID=UPI00189154F7|nr:hypothetical protein [Candidatus Clavichlamydia salmonicola]MBF5051351.1 hypothetical protein [Candidatus Clavichlamydia salmonicola]
MHQILTTTHIAMKLTAKHIKHLYSSEYKGIPFIKYLDPITKKTKDMSLLNVLPHILHGLQENMYAFPRNLPLVVNNTQNYQTPTHLEESIKLIRNRLSIHATEWEAVPYILEKLLTTAHAKEDDCDED